MKFITNSSSMALWYDIIHDAEQSCSIPLNTELESYLVLLLNRFTSHRDLLKEAIAINFLEGMQSDPLKRQVVLQEVGDKCLIYTGLYPKIAAKRQVKLSYFVKLGQSAYSAISSDGEDLYATLGSEFVSLMDILQSIRLHSKDCPDLLPLEAYEQWNDTGSKRAYAILKQYTACTPVAMQNLDPVIFKKLGSK